VEFFSKLEPSDRFLTYETALNYSGLGNKEFTRLLDTTSLVAMFLLHFYEKAGIKLWDGKLEFVRMGGLVLGDAITPDELRLTFRGVQISKEPLRQYYRRYHAPFLAAIKRAKDISAKTGEPLGEILRNRLRVRPANLSEDFREAAAGMYTALCAKTTGIDVFEKHPSLPQVLEVFKRYKVA